MVEWLWLGRRSMLMTLFCCATMPVISAAQVPSADSLASWIRRGYSFTMEGGQTPADTQAIRQVWGEMGFAGAGYGFRSFSARGGAGSAAATVPSLGVFMAATEYYRVRLDELRTAVIDNIGLAWGVHTEEFKPRGQPAEAIRVRFTNTLQWDGTRWKNLLYHRDAQLFDENGRYIRTIK